MEEEIFKDINNFENFARDQYLYFAFICDKCERYEDMLKVLNYMFRKFEIIMKNEKNLFEKAIKNIIQNKQKKLNKLSNLIKEAKKSQNCNKSFSTYC